MHVNTFLLFICDERPRFTPTEHKWEYFVYIQLHSVSERRQSDNYCAVSQNTHTHAFLLIRTCVIPWRYDIHIVRTNLHIYYEFCGIHNFRD